MKEQFNYRARKKLFQLLLSSRDSEQLRRLERTEWDILVVLDACRYDVLSTVSGWPIEQVLSPASCTPEWLEAVVQTGTFEGCHVITANPQYEKVDAELGAKSIDHCWEREWCEKLQTTLPEPLLEEATELTKERSAVAVHLQQPHWPYVARLGDSWALAYDNLGPWEYDSEKITSYQVAMQRGLIDIEKARRAYEASVQSIWSVLVEYLGRWLDQNQTVVVTADHGETFGRVGELGFFEHPCKVHLKPLVRVPWLELNPPSPRSEASDDVQGRLEALGYAE